MPSLRDCERYDDVLLAASACVKENERLVAKPPSAPVLEVFARLAGDSGFEAFTRRYAIARKYGTWRDRLSGIGPPGG